MGLIPSSTVYSVRKEASPTFNIVTWGVQKNLNALGWGLATDGLFGKATHEAVRQFQSNEGLAVDGIFGPASSSSMARELERRVTADLPEGLLRGQVTGESGDLVGAVNWTVAGGVDCSYTQRRVLEADYADEAVVKRAFDGYYQLNLSARTLRGRKDTYYGKTGAPTHEKAWRLAMLSHNYPYGADQIATKGVSGLSSYWTTPQTWVKNIGAKFPDGNAVETPLEWCQHYSLGSAAHNDPGTMTKYVNVWSP